jgi:hypothetical protein
MEDLRIDLPGDDGHVRFRFKNGQFMVEIADDDLGRSAEAVLFASDVDLAVVRDWLARAAAEAPKPDPLKVYHFRVGRGYATVAANEKTLVAGVALCAPGDAFSAAEGERIARSRADDNWDWGDPQWQRLQISDLPAHVSLGERARRNLEFMIDACDAPAWAKGAEIAPVAETHVGAWLDGGCAMCGKDSRDHNNFACDECSNGIYGVGWRGFKARFNEAVEACKRYAAGRVAKPAR